MTNTTVQTPAELTAVLKSNPKAKKLWDSLTPIARRDFVSWIDDAKQDKTRQSRVERVPSMLEAGKRRPCCYALVPMSLYKALGKMPKAKATWSKLSPDEKRDYISWANAEKDKAKHAQRVVQICDMLAAGKLHP